MTAQRAVTLDNRAEVAPCAGCGMTVRATCWRPAGARFTARWARVYRALGSSTVASRLQPRGFSPATSAISFDAPQRMACWLILSEADQKAFGENSFYYDTSEILATIR